VASAVSVARRNQVETANLPNEQDVLESLRVTLGAEPRQHVRDALLAEPALLDCAIYEEVRDNRHLVRDPPGRRGEVTIIVEDGVVTLDGELPSRAHKRLAGVLAWWVPGSRDVVDGLGVTPYEKDNDEEISDAVRMALEKDPFVDASQVRVVTGGGVVGLTGFVSSEAERDMAENDAWYVFGVGDVINGIEVSK
jgi:osmotically-inducible protein OsmY